MHGFKKKLLENININPLMYFYSILFPCAKNYEDLSLQIQKKTLNSFQLSKIYSSNVSFSSVFKVLYCFRRR